MTDKDKHVLGFWHAKLWDCNQTEARYVSAGEVAKYVGQSTETAKKYLKRLVKEGGAVTAKRQHPNKIKYDVYHVQTEEQLS